MKGIVFDIDHFAVHDGSGIRTSVFLKGCPLKCLWCHSPESQERKESILFLRSRCTGCGSCVDVCKFEAQVFDKSGHRTYNRKNCTNCGECIRKCAYNALKMCGKVMSSQEVVEEVIQDIVFFRNSGGGVTLSGGEVLAQPLFTIDVLKRLKEHGIHTIVETCGMGEWKYLEQMYSLVNLFYYDLKILDASRHLKFTGMNNERILENFFKLRQLTDNIIIRVPLIPGYTDNWENISAIMNLAVNYKIKEIHLLPYNPSAAAKYEWIGRDYFPGKLVRQDKEYFNALKEKLAFPITVKIIE